MLVKRNNKPGYGDILGSMNNVAVWGGFDIDEAYIVPACNHTILPDSDNPLGRAFVDINHVDSPIVKRNETFIDNKVIHRAGGVTYEATEIGRNKFKLFIKYDTRPPALTKFKISKSDNLTAHRQILTDELKAEGHIYGYREAEGALAFYFNDGTRDNEAQSGLALLIDCMYYVDAAGAKSPLLHMELDSFGNLDVHHTPEVETWFDDPARVGPFYLDPLIGSDSKGPILFNGSGLVLYWAFGQAIYDGQVEAFNCYVNSDVNLYKMGVALTDGLPNYIPDGLPVIAYTPAVVGNSAGITTLPVIANDILSAGEYYRVCIMQNVIQAAIWGAIKSPTDPAPRTSYAQDFNIDPRSPVPVTNKPTPSNTDLSMWMVYSAIGVSDIIRSIQAELLGIKSAFRAQGSGQARNLATKGGFR